jgi:hypothetical protein
MLFEAVIGCGSLDICRLWLTSYWLAGPVTADPRGVAEERPALPKVGVPSLLSSADRARRGWCRGDPIRQTSGPTPSAPFLRHGLFSARVQAATALEFTGLQPGQPGERFVQVGEYTRTVGALR